MRNLPAITRLALASLLVAIASTAGAANSLEEFSISRPSGDLTIAVLSPEPDQLAADPLLLLNFSADRAASLPGGKYGSITQKFIDAGHRVASFDLPAHGDRVDELGGSIKGLAALVVAGRTPFDVFVEDGKLAVDELIKRGFAKPGRVLLCGVSRAGYCVLRLAAVDDRIAATAALAPVTDWRVLREFDGVKDQPEVAALALTNSADELAGKRIYVAIGNADTRVGTAACTAFILAVNEAERDQGITASALRYIIDDETVDHSLNSQRRKDGIQFLLTEPQDGDKQSAEMP